MRFLLATVLILTVVGGCGGSDSPTALPEMGTLTIRMDRFRSLQQLGSGFTYEGWILVNENPISTGRFTADYAEFGVLSDTTFTVSQESLEAATKFMITIERTSGGGPGPSSRCVVAGDFDGDSTWLTVADPAAFGDDFMTASGSFVLETPSTADDPDDFRNGIWWYTPGDPHTASLSLPVLPDGWVYEGWVVVQEGSISTGRFTEFDAADFDGGGATAGPDDTPAFPGQDFINPPISLAQFAMMITIEPEPDDSPEPYVTLRPLQGATGNPVEGGVSQNMGNGAMTLPIGRAIRSYPE